MDFLTRPRAFLVLATDRTGITRLAPHTWLRIWRLAGLAARTTLRMRPSLISFYDTEDIEFTDTVRQTDIPWSWLPWLWPTRKLQSMPGPMPEPTPEPGDDPLRCCPKEWANLGSALVAGLSGDAALVSQYVSNFPHRVGLGLARAGHLTLLHTHETTLKPHYRKMFSAAASSGNIDVVKWCERMFIGVALPYYHFESDGLVKVVLNRAALLGHQNIVDWCIDNLEFRPTESCRDAMSYATFGGHLHILNFLKSRTGPSPTGAHALMIGTAWHGHIHVLDWLEREYGMPPKIEEVVAAAARLGHIPVLEWCVTRIQDRRVPDIDWSAVVNSAAIGNRVLILDWCRSRHAIRYGPLSYYAAAGRHLNAFEWCERHDPTVDLAFMLQCTIRKGDLRVVKWCIRVMRSRGIKPDFGLCMTAAVRASHEFIIKWLIRKHAHSSHHSISACDVMRIAGTAGNIHIVIWCAREDPRMDLQQTIEAATREGHQNIVDWCRRENVARGHRHHVENF